MVPNNQEGEGQVFAAYLPEQGIVEVVTAGSSRGACFFSGCMLCGSRRREGEQEYKNG